MKRVINVLMVFMLILISAAGAFAQQTSRIDEIIKRGTIRVGTPGDYRPFSMQMGDNKYEGFDIEVIEHLADELGVKVEYVKTSWPDLMNGLLENKYDIAVGGITQTVARMQTADFLPAYAPSSKVPLIKVADKNKYRSLADIDKAGVTVIVNPGGTNEKFVLENIKTAKVVTHPNNHEIPGLIAEGKGDIMFTDAYEAVVYSKIDNRLMTAEIDKSLTKVTYMGFMIPEGDEKFARTMNFIWNEAERRGNLKEISAKWLE